MNETKYRMSLPVGIIVGMIIPIMTFTGTIFVKVWSIADLIATKSEVNQLRADFNHDTVRMEDSVAKSVAQSRAYTDEKVIQMRLEAFDHSDQARAEMKTEAAEIRGQLNLILALLRQFSHDKHIGSLHGY